MRFSKPRQLRLNPRDAVAGAALAVAVHVVAAWALAHRPVGGPLDEPPLINVTLLAAPAPPIPPDLPPAPPNPPAAAPVQPAAVSTPTRRTTPPRPVPIERAHPPSTVVTKSLPAPTKPEPGDSDPTPAPAPAAAVTAQATDAGPALVKARFDADYLNNPPPTYPPLSRRLAEQGRVLVRVLVDSDGTPAKVELRESSGYHRLDQAAVAAIRRWRFVPARRGDQPVDAWVLVPIAFNLRS